MSYQLCLVGDPSEEHGKAVGEHVFIQNVPQNSKVYLFYYPGAMPNREVEDALRKLGQSTGENLFVDIGKLNDPQHEQIVGRFGINRYPVIVVTADSSLASPQGMYATAFVRIDSKSLLSSPERTVDCVQKIFNLFLQHEIVTAMSVAKWTQRSELLLPVRDLVVGALKGLWDFVKHTEISYSFVEGKLELKPHS